MPSPASPADPSPAAAPPRALTVGLLLTMSLHAIHGLAVVTVLPVVARDLGEPALYGAVLASYLLASLVGLAWAGREADRKGLLRPFAWGMLVFAAGLCASGVSPSMRALVVARAVEGLGGGMLSAILFASVHRAYPATLRPRVLAWLAAAWVVPGLLAPPIAGFLAEVVGWRSVILGLLPGVAIAATLAAPPLAGLGRRTPVSQPGGPGVAAALCLAGGLAVAALSAALPVPFVARGTGVLLGGALALAALRRLLPDGTLRLRPGLPAAIAAKLGLAFAFFAVDSFLPLVLTGVHGRSAAFAGLAMTLGALCWTAGSFAHARCAAAVSGGAAILGACAGLGVGVACVAGALLPGAPVAGCFVGFGLAGVGMGAGTNAASVMAMGSTPAGREGATSTALGLGDALGVSLATGLGGVALATGGASPIPALSGLWGVAALALVGVAVSACRADPPARQGVRVAA